MAVCTYYQYNTMIMLAGQSHINLEILCQECLCKAHGFIPGLTSLVENIMPGNTQSGNVYLKLLTWNDIMLPEES